MEKKSRENASEIGIAQTHLTKQVLETVQGMQVIKSYNLGGKNNKELSNAFERKLQYYNETGKNHDAIISPYSELFLESVLPLLLFYLPSITLKEVCFWQMRLCL